MSQAADEPGTAARLTVVTNPWTHPIPRQVVPLASIQSCVDRRYPKISGLYVLDCSTGKHPNRLTYLPTGQQRSLGDGSASPALHHDQVLIFDEMGEHWTFPETSPARTIRNPGITGIPAFDGNAFALSTKTSIQIGHTHSTKRTKIHAAPAPWYSVALSNAAPIWVQWTGDRTALYTVQSPNTSPVVFAAGQGRNHHVAADGDYVVWIHNGNVVVANPSEGWRYTYGADAGFETGPMVQDGHACFLDRRHGLTAQCIDGWQTAAKHISGAGPLVLVETGSGFALHVATHWSLYPNAQGNALIRDWWGSGTIHIQQLTEGVWQELAELSPPAGETLWLPLESGHRYRAHPGLLPEYNQP